MTSLALAIAHRPSPTADRRPPAVHRRQFTADRRQLLGGSRVQIGGLTGANVVTPILSGMPATGAIARTATKVKAGGRTPVAGIVHALTVLLITLAFEAWAEITRLPSDASGQIGSNKPKTRRTPVV